MRCPRCGGVMIWSHEWKQWVCHDCGGEVE